MDGSLAWITDDAIMIELQKRFPVAAFIGLKPYDEGSQERIVMLNGDAMACIGAIYLLLQSAGEAYERTQTDE